MSGVGVEKLLISSKTFKIRGMESDPIPLSSIGSAYQKCYNGLDADKIREDHIRSQGPLLGRG